MEFQRAIRKAYTERMNSVSDNITIPSERLKLSISKLDQSDIVESYFSNGDAESQFLHQPKRYH